MYVKKEQARNFHILPKKVYSKGRVVNRNLSTENIKAYLLNRVPYKTVLDQKISM